MGDIRPNSGWVLAWVVVGGAALSLVFQEVLGTGSLEAGGGFVAAALAAAVWSWLKDQRELEPEERAGVLHGVGPFDVLAIVVCFAIAALLGVALLEMASVCGALLLIAFALRSRERPRRPPSAVAR